MVVTEHLVDLKLMAVDYQVWTSLLFYSACFLAIFLNISCGVSCFMHLVLSLKSLSFVTTFLCSYTPWSRIERPIGR